MSARPDLIGSKGFTAEEMGGFLYDSLHEKILPLPDETEVYPAHGAGSLCGKSLSKETWSTLGEQRKSNYALQPMSKEEFIKIVASDQPEVPAYFPESAAQNLKGSKSLEDLPKPKEFSTDEIENFDGVSFGCSQWRRLRRRSYSERDQHRTRRTIRFVGGNIDHDRNADCRLPPKRKKRLTKHLCGLRGSVSKPSKVIF